MKAIETPIIISSIRSKVDGSLGFSASTPELTPKEKVAFFELQNQNLNGFFEPAESKPTEVKKVKGELWEKSPSQRLYAVIFLYWKQQGEQGDFNVFYKKQMERLINKVKDLLEP